MCVPMKVTAASTAAERDQLNMLCGRVRERVDTRVGTRVDTRV
jgi:hypothetical protein